MGAGGGVLADPGIVVGAPGEARVLVMAGIDHRSASLEVRERCAVAVEERLAERAALRRRFGAVVLLSTCGRTEVYTLASAEEVDVTATTAAEWIAGRAGPARAEVLGTVAVRSGEEALRHLVRVACGLESALEGEDEILGQTRRAWLDAANDGDLPGPLDAAFRLAVRTGRAARRLGDDGGWTSLADGAAAQVAALTERLPAPRVLVAGTGPMGTRAARTLRERLGERLTLTLAGRTPERLQVHATALRARPVQLAELPEAFAWADAAIVGLRTRTALIDVTTVRPRPQTRPLTIVDLSLPRAVHPDVASVPGVTLQDVDAITRGESALSRWRPQERAQVSRLVEDAVRSYTARLDPSDATATLTTLRLRAEAVRRSQLSRTLARLPGLDDEARYAVEAMSRAIVNRLLHDTTVHLRSDEHGEVAGQVRMLFGLEG